MANIDACLTSKTPEWYTPPYVLNIARQILGAIDLDPASCLAAQQTVQADHYYAAHDDGLSRPWFGRVWLNPPYGDTIGQWLARAMDAAATGEIDALLMLLPARTSAAWFQDYAAMAHMCFWRGRITFVGAENTAPFPSVLAYVGPHPERFHMVMAPYGLTCQPMRPLAPSAQMRLFAA